VVSQILLAIPMWLLFEAGILFSALIPSSEADEDAS